jgi:hypothetical protein
MRPAKILRYLLLLLAVTGLLLTPILRSTLAASATHAESAAVEDAMASMPEGMPCCPDQAPSSDCIKGCPLLAICMSSLMQSPPVIGLSVPYRLAGLLAADSDARPEGLGQPPPGRPPKS